ncbi:hypothetical protein ACQKDY_19460 [Alteromonas macleodii]|uniref:hypothetical protein n=1 Tax=Alteromonas macleodii TaxID=28108 RepID=UPI003D083A9B
MMLDFRSLMSKADLSAVLEPDLFLLESKTSVELEKLSCQWFKTYLYSAFDEEIYFSKNIDFICFRSLPRDDYASLEDEIVDTVSNELSVLKIRDYQKSSRSPNWRFLDIFREITSTTRKIEASSNLIRYCATLRLSWYLYVAEIILSQRFKVLLCFADMQPQENLLAQLSKIVFPDRITATLQHGLYADYQEFETVNVVNYKNHVCDYFLAWGEDTKRLIEKYNKNAHVLICGKPSVFGLPISKRNQAVSCPDILVVTDQRIFQEYNERLVGMAVQVAEKLNVDVFVRFHPSNNKRIIKDKYPTIKELKYIKKDYIILGVTTSMVYEGLVMGYRAFQMQSDLYCPRFPENLIFSDPSGLESLIKSSANQSVAECQSFGKSFIDAVGDSSLNNYRKALLTLQSNAN